jgi:2-methylcitrate dehydratase PrpD
MGVNSVTMPKNLEARISDWISALDRRALSPAVVEKLKLAALDTFAAILSGVSEAVSRKVVAFAEVPADRAEASIIGFAARADLRGAALANGTMGHACDYDDSSWTMWGHPTAPVLPAVLAIAEHRDRSGMAFLVGLAAGLEIEKTLGLGCQPEHYDRGYHPTGSLGVFGAAAGAAKMLELDAARICMALGISASRAAGLRGNSGTMTKPLHVGFAARDGVEAALFAQAGMTASPTVISGALGFFGVCSPDHGELDWITDRLGNPFEVIDPGLSPKLYPSCSETHAATDAILQMRAEGLRASDVRQICCGMTPAAYANLVYHDPTTPLQAKFSQEYCLAAPLVFGRLGLAEFDPDAVMNTEVRALIARTQVAIHPDLSGRDSVSFSSPAIVEVETNDGRALRKTIREMRGHPKNPLMPSEIEAKFIECGERVLPKAAVRNALANIQILDELASIRELVANLRPQ